jgi:hypothetical protein
MYRTDSAHSRSPLHDLAAAAAGVGAGVGEPTGQPGQPGIRGYDFATSSSSGASTPNNGGHVHYDETTLVGGGGGAYAAVGGGGQEQRYTTVPLGPPGGDEKRYDVRPAAGRSRASGFLGGVFGKDRGGGELGALLWRGCGFVDGVLGCVRTDGRAV